MFFFRWTLNFFYLAWQQNIKSSPICITLPKPSRAILSARLYGLTSRAHFIELMVLTLSLTGVGPSGPALTYMQIPLKVQKVRYRKKLGIPQAGSWDCFKIKTVPI